MNDTVISKEEYRLLRERLDNIIRELETLKTSLK